MEVRQGAGYGSFSRQERGYQRMISMASGKDALFSLLNLVWAFVIVAPLTVLYWKGTWDLLQDVVNASLPDNSSHQLSGLISYLAGIGTRIILDLSKCHLGEKLSSQRVWVRALGGWVYTAIYTLAGVSFWRGVWYLMELDVGAKVMQLSIVLIASIAILTFCRASRSLISSPLGLSVDDHETTFKVSTFFRRDPSQPCWFVTDVIFTNVVIRQLIVFSWWSLWSLENLFLIHKDMKPGEKPVAYDSLLLGYSACLLTFLLDRALLKQAPTARTYILRPLQFIIVMLGYFGCVNVWRGVWSIYDAIEIPALGEDGNYLLDHFLALFILSFMFLSTSISNDRIEWDVGEHEEIVSIKYFGTRQADDATNEMLPILE